MDSRDYILINAFTGEEALGNQCCVLIHNNIEDRASMKRIARDMNMPATTFLSPVSENEFNVRWFAPAGEIDLCGHGSVAAMSALNAVDGLTEIKLNYRSGSLTCSMIEGVAWIEGDAIPCKEQAIPEHIERGFHGKAKAYYPSSNKHLVLFDSEEDVVRMNPDWYALRASETFAYAITAEGEKSDFVSRTLLPHLSFLEDQATGSSHMVLTPFWSEKLHKQDLVGLQRSARGGHIHCRADGDRVRIGGECQIFASGRLV